MISKLHEVCLFTAKTGLLAIAIIRVVIEARTVSHHCVRKLASSISEIVRERTVTAAETESLSLISTITGINAPVVRAIR